MNANIPDIGAQSRGNGDRQRVTEVFGCSFAAATRLPGVWRIRGTDPLLFRRRHGCGGKTGDRELCGPGGKLRQHQAALLKGCALSSDHNAAATARG